jgi:hypothetical protein
MICFLHTFYQLCRHPLRSSSQELAHLVVRYQQKPLNPCWYEQRTAPYTPNSRTLPPTKPVPNHAI